MVNIILFEVTVKREEKCMKHIRYKHCKQIHLKNIFKRHPHVFLNTKAAFPGPHIMKEKSLRKLTSSKEIIPSH